MIVFTLANQKKLMEKKTTIAVARSMRHLPVVLDMLHGSKTVCDSVDTCSSYHTSCNELHVQ